MATSFGCSSRRSTRPRTTTTASFSSSAPNSAITRGKTNTSIEAWRSSRTNRAMRSPFFVYCRRSSVTTPPTDRTTPSVPGGPSNPASPASRRSASGQSVSRARACSSPISGWSLT